jgi:hypothetical protein
MSDEFEAAIYVLELCRPTEETRRAGRQVSQGQSGCGPDCGYNDPDGHDLFLCVFRIAVLTIPGLYA